MLLHVKAASRPYTLYSSAWLSFSAANTPSFLPVIPPPRAIQNPSFTATVQACNRSRRQQPRMRLCSGQQVRRRGEHAGPPLPWGGWREKQPGLGRSLQTFCGWLSRQWQRLLLNQPVGTAPLPGRFGLTGLEVFPVTRPVICFSSPSSDSFSPLSSPDYDHWSGCWMGCYRESF